MGSFSDPALILPGSITDTEVAAAAAIAKTKLASLDIVNADVNTSAAIAGTKLESGWQKNTANGIVGLDSSGIAPHIVTKTASANIRNSHDAEDFMGIAIYTKRKTITLTNGLKGQQRFLFDIHIETGGFTAYGKIYRNGVALGTEQTDTTGTYVTKSEDITQAWNPGDTCELWIKSSTGAQSTYIRNFRIAYDDSPTVAVASSNS